MKQIQTVRTPEGQLPLILPTAKRLLAEGVISGALDGDLHAKDAATVKAAIMSMSVCDFCSTPGATHYFDVPDFGITTDSRGGTNFSPMVGTSTGGWIGCDECNELIVADKRDKLLDRAVSIHAFPKFSRHAIKELYDKFWQGMDERAEALRVARALTAVVNDEFSDIVELTGNSKLSDRETRINSMAKTTGLTREEVVTFVEGGPPAVSRQVVEKLAHWSKTIGTMTGHSNASEIGKLLLAHSAPHKPIAYDVPHWQRALDMKFAAHTFLSSVAKAPSMRELGFSDDAKILLTAQAYSFNAETIAAILEAAKSIPHDSPLSSIETPTGSGWFWFAEPMHISPSPASEVTNALLWAWQPGEKLAQISMPSEYLEGYDLQVNVVRGDTPPRLNEQQVIALKDAFKAKGVTEKQLNEWITFVDGPPSLVFSAYVFDNLTLSNWKKTLAPIPSTRWYWRLDETFHDMIGRNILSWDQRYGPGGPFEKISPKLNKQQTNMCIAELSLFFLMSCVWFKQTIERPAVLQREQGPMERQQRKRLQKEHQLNDIPTVQVIALRKSAKTPTSAETVSGAKGTRNYQVRWIVQGHTRLQACGPGRKDRKLIWIDAHPAGPEDKPLRTREKVYAIVR